jgi:hypothetical protein
LGLQSIEMDLSFQTAIEITGLVDSRLNPSDRAYLALKKSSILIDSQLNSEENDTNVRKQTNQTTFRR